MDDIEEIQNDPEHQAWIQECAEGCDCCQICIGAPCDGCMTGGMCDALPCRCGVIDYDDDDETDDLDGDYWL